MAKLSCGRHAKDGQIVIWEACQGWPNFHVYGRHAKDGQIVMYMGGMARMAKLSCE